MALKDWKKQYYKRCEETVWRKPNKTSIAMSTYHNRNGKRWEVYLLKLHGGLKLDLTKQQALNYAKNYMRKH